MDPSRRYSSADALRKALKSAQWGWWLVTGLALILVIVSILASRWPVQSDDPLAIPVDSQDTQSLQIPVRDTVYLVVPAQKAPHAPKKKTVGTEEIDALFNEAAASFDGLD